MNNVFVIGSLNMDLIAKTPRLPQKGETILGTEFLNVPGGKGANQAVAASLAEGKTWMLGKVGKDAYGTALIENLEEAGVKTETIFKDDAARTGVAVISVDEEGNNTIIVIPGTNGLLTKQNIDTHKHLFTDADNLLLQMEIPLGVVFYSIKVASNHQSLAAILDPAPADEISDSIYPLIDVLTPNLTEAKQLSGLEVTDRSEYDKLADYFLDKGVGTVLLTCGAEGVLVKNNETNFFVEGFEVEAKDTTAAGDCFAGAFAAKYNQDNLREAVLFANAAAAISTTIVGAQSSVPTKQKVEDFLAKNY